MIRAAALTLAICAAFAAEANAGVVSTSGDVVEAAFDSREAVAQFFLHDVRQTVSDRFVQDGFPTPTATVFLPQGTWINEYWFNFSPASAQGGANGSVTFDADIFGVYNGTFSALEEQDVTNFPGTADTVVISADRRTVTFSLNVNTGNDQFVLLVSNPAPAPAPGTAPLATLALGLLLGAVKAKKRHA